MRCQYFKDEKKKREKKCKLSLSLARENTFNIRTASLKATFNGRRTEPLSLSLSLSSFQGKTREKKISRRRIFSLFHFRKDKKKQAPPPKKRKKILPLLPTPSLFLPPRFGWGPKNVSLPTMMMCAQTNAPPYNKQQRERRADFKLAQKQPNVMHCYDASGRARVRTRCGSDRARFTHFFSPLQIPVIKLSLFSSLFRVK